MLSILAILILLLAPAQRDSEVSVAQKQEFIALLKSLPTKGEFYTDESVQKAAPFISVLFALTDKDLAGRDIYPFAAISSGLGESEEIRKYAVQHFSSIQHPELKLFWGAMLFDRGASSPGVTVFLRRALESKEQAKVLSEMIGPKFEDFKRRVLLP